MRLKCSTSSGCCDCSFLPQTQTDIDSDKRSRRGKTGSVGKATEEPGAETGAGAGARRARSHEPGTRRLEPADRGRQLPKRFVNYVVEGLQLEWVLWGK